MTPKQKRFVEEYLIDLNATQAAIRAGYAESGARTEGARLLANANIQEALTHSLKERSERAQIDADWVLARAVELFERCKAESDRTNERQTLDLIGKHVDVGAYEERVRQDVNVVDRTELVRRARSEVSEIFGERRAGAGVGDSSGGLPH